MTEMTSWMTALLRVGAGAGAGATRGAGAAQGADAAALAAAAAGAAAVLLPQGKRRQGRVVAVDMAGRRRQRTCPAKTSQTMKEGTCLHPTHLAMTAMTAMTMMRRRRTTLAAVASAATAVGKVGWFSSCR